ncbi:unnamed protein product [Microthlaspi erraticum]|uniref:Uncharacterized protein n=1 Tax=Microthlaspi erraticum TaxID=1685480 RepID=A0A6D2JLQ5_9BRAS|nr:unnamed protein product [Microthlaspi erraticum]
MFFPFSSLLLSILTISTESNYSSNVDLNQFAPPAAPSLSGISPRIRSRTVDRRSQTYTDWSQFLHRNRILFIVCVKRSQQQCLHPSLAVATDPKPTQTGPPNSTTVNGSSSCPKLIVKVRTFELDRKLIKLQIWDTAGHEWFQTITTAVQVYVFVRVISASPILLFFGFDYDKIVSSPSSSDEFKVLLQVGRRLPLPTSTYMAFKMLDCTMKLPKQLFGKAE